MLRSRTMLLIVLLALPIVTLSVVSCVEPIDFAPLQERKVVVNCVLQNSDVQTLRLTHSSSFADSNYEEVAHATATLFEEEVEVGKFIKKSYANWELRFRPRSGKKYKLIIEIPNTPLITASTTFPYHSEIRVLEDKNSDSGIRFFQKTSGTPLFWVFALRNPDQPFRQKPIIESHYKLIQKIGTDYASVDPFNSFGTSVEVDATTPLHLAYLRMLPNAEINQFCLERWLFHCVVVFRTPSVEYDNYLKSSISKMLVYQSFDDPTQWLDESSIYTNINNGVGIFGAFIDTIIPITQ